MKELEKTKRISIAAVLTILLVIIALLSYKRPSHLYSESIEKSLELVSNSDYIFTQQDLEKYDFELVDVRSNIEYIKGHLDNAINIYVPEILDRKNSEFFQEMKENNKTVVLYGASPNEALTPFMLLQQLGYNNIKILTVDLEYSQDKLIVKSSTLEENKYDIKKYIDESIKKATAKPKTIPKPKPVVKKITPVKKNKKLPVEGGC